MKYSRVLTIQDISCFGQCSTTVALPILSATGVETVILPSSILSTHTGGFTDYAVKDLTDQMPKIIEHWQKQGIIFDCIYTGYLGNNQQIEFVKQIAKTLGKNAQKIIDPVLGDNGQLYKGFTLEYVNQMKILCEIADVILPNVTEACLLTNSEYKQNYTSDYIENLLKKLLEIGAKTVVLTGVSYQQDQTGVMIAKGDYRYYYQHKKIPDYFHGTGDIYASTFVGAYMKGLTIEKAVQIAADYTLKCIELTKDDKVQHWYGVKFELAIPYLLTLLGVSTIA